MNMYIVYNFVFVRFVFFKYYNLNLIIIFINYYLFKGFNLFIDLFIVFLCFFLIRVKKLNIGLQRAFWNVDSELVGFVLVDKV